MKYEYEDFAPDGSVSFLVSFYLDTFERYLKCTYLSGIPVNDGTEQLIKSFTLVHARLPFSARYGYPPQQFGRQSGTCLSPSLQE